MPDTITRERSPLDQIIFRRTKLPTHECPGANRRRWALAVCTAEVDHATNEFWTLNHQYGGWDRHDAPAAPQLAMWPHERAAARVLNWISYLQTTEWEISRQIGRGALRHGRAELRRLFARRLTIKTGFRQALTDYCNARGIAQ